MMGKKMCALHMVAWWLLVIGGLNWGLEALGYNLVEMLLGSWPVVVKVVYGLVGLSALAMLVKGKCKACMGDKGAMPMGDKKPGGMGQ